MSYAMRSDLAVAALLVAGCAAPVTAADTDALALERKIPLGEVAGRIDHLAVDLGRHRVFIAELGNDTVGVVDIESGAVAGRITGLAEPQGVAYVPGADVVYVANARDGAVHRYRGADLAPVGVVNLADDADNLRVDDADGQVVAGYGDGALAFLDAASGAVRGEIKLPAHPESFQLERAGTRIFVNLPQAGGSVAVVDRAARRAVASWRVDGAGGNFPMALDEAEARLVVAYRSPATLAVFDTRTGTLAQRLATCGDADDVFVDAKRWRAYAICGDGEVAVLERRGDAYAELGRVKTVSGARTGLFVPELDRLYVAVRARAREPAALWVFRPVGGGP